MSNISSDRYVSINTQVIAGSTIQRRELIGRLFTDNPLLPVGSMLEFTSTTAVINYFGVNSAEADRANRYFTYINKNFSSPTKISFARWVDVATAPYLYGAKLTASLSAFQAINNGSFTLTLGGVTHNIGLLDFTSATSFADIASDIQAAINAETGLQWTAATVTYDNIRTAFNFVGGDAVAADIIVAAGTTGTDISVLMGWLSPNAILSSGSAVETITEVLTNSANSSDNFGSFLFMPSLDISQIVEAANWSQLQNVKYQFFWRTTLSTYVSDSAATIGIASNGATVAPLSNQYPEQLPMEVLAATNYDANISVVQNYMFQQQNYLTPSVSDDTTADGLDAARVNYYGQTQTAGTLLAFYQRGVLMGDPTQYPVDMNIHANEQWFKAEATAQFLNLLVGVTRIPANDSGISQILATLQSVIDQAKTNGTISVQRFLTDAQKQQIKQATGTDDDSAWQQVQSIGYWRNVVIQPVIVNNRTEYVGIYTVVYATDQAIRKIEGNDLLLV
jgi:Protein of unknown function (DUF3383)